MNANISMLIDERLIVVKSHIDGIAKAGEHTRALIALFGEPSKFSEYCLNNGLWPNKRTIQGQDSDKPCGAQVLLKWCHARPGDEKAVIYAKSARAFQAMASMLSEEKRREKERKEKEELEKQAELEAKEQEKKELEELAGIVSQPVITAISPSDCPVTTVWDTDYPYVITFPLPLVRERVVTTDNLLAILSEVSEKSSKTELLAIISKIKEVIA